MHGLVGAAASGDPAALIPPVSRSAVDWRLISRIPTNTTDGFTGAIQMQWLNAAGSPVSTSGATFSGSAAQSGSVANLFNGTRDSTTWYQSAVIVNCEMRTTFPGSTQVSGIKIWAMTANGQRTPGFFDIEYSTNGGSSWTNLFSGVFDTWVTSGSNVATNDANAKTFMDPGLGGQTDWIIAVNATAGALTWFESEIILRSVAGGSNIATGGTPRGSINVTNVANCFDGNTATQGGSAGASSRNYDNMGITLAAPAKVVEFCRIPSATQGTSTIKDGTILAGSGRSFKRRLDFTNSTAAANPAITVLTIP